MVIDRLVAERFGQELRFGIGINTGDELHSETTVPGVSDHYRHRLGR